MAWDIVSRLLPFFLAPSNVLPSCIDENLVGVAGKCFHLEEISLYEERGNGIGKMSTRRKLLTTSPRNRCYIHSVPRRDRNQGPHLATTLLDTQQCLVDWLPLFLNHCLLTRQSQVSKLRRNCGEGRKMWRCPPEKKLKKFSTLV